MKDYMVYLSTGEIISQDSVIDSKSLYYLAKERVRQEDVASAFCKRLNSSDSDIPVWCMLYDRARGSFEFGDVKRNTSLLNDVKAQMLLDGWSDISYINQVFTGKHFESKEVQIDIDKLKETYCDVTFNPHTGFIGYSN